jgi:hypothetical protein
MDPYTQYGIQKGSLADGWNDLDYPQNKGCVCVQAVHLFPWELSQSTHELYM